MNCSSHDDHGYTSASLTLTFLLRNSIEKTSCKCTRPSQAVTDTERMQVGAGRTSGGAKAPTLATGPWLGRTSCSLDACLRVHKSCKTGGRTPEMIQLQWALGDRTAIKLNLIFFLRTNFTTACSTTPCAQCEA